MSTNAGLASNFKVYNDQVQTGIIETIQQFGDVFNTPSRNTIRLTTETLKGAFAQRAFFKRTNAVRRRDTTTNAPITPTVLTQDEFISVKLNRLYAIEQTMDAFEKAAIGRTEQEMSLILGRQMGPEVQVEMLNSSLLALRAALLSQFADVGYAVPTSPGDGTINTKALVLGAQKFGDRQGRILAWVMHSKVHADLMLEQISNPGLTQVSDFNVVNAAPVTLNRPVIVTDSDALVVTSGSPAVTKYYTLGLTADAVEAIDSERVRYVIDTPVLFENLSVVHHSEYAFNVGVKGFRYNTSSGENPTSATLGNTASWIKAATSHKDLAGIIIESR